MTRMTGPDCAVMCNLINTYTHTHTRYRDCVKLQLKHTWYLVFFFINTYRHHNNSILILLLLLLVVVVPIYMQYVEPNRQNFSKYCARKYSLID